MEHLKININVTKNKKVNYWINKIINAVHKDISSSYGGWFFFIGRMFSNIIYLYFTMVFLRAFLLFAFHANGITDQERLDIISTVLWAVGLIYLVVRIPLWREDEKEKLKSD